jgi:hypothetical protein
MEVRVPRTVALERRSSGVERVAVDLHDQTVVRPEEVDLVARDHGVDPRRWKPRRADQRQHALLGLGSRERGLVSTLHERAQDPRAAAALGVDEKVVELRSGDQPKPLRFAQRALELARSDDVGEVEERPRGTTRRDTALELSPTARSCSVVIRPR